jgi:hypothetical protein
VNVATDSRYRGQGVFSTLERENEDAAAESGSPLTVTFPNAKSFPIFVGRLGWTDLPPRRLWAKPLSASALVRYALGRSRGGSGGMQPPDASSRTTRGLEVRSLARFGAGLDELGRRAAAGYGSHFVRDALYFNWRYLDSPRDYRCFGAFRGGELVGVVVVGHTLKHGVSAGFVADLVVGPGDGVELRALIARAVEEVRGADALVLLPPRSRAHRRVLVRAGFAPTNEKLRFIGKPLRDGVVLDDRPGAWHFTLGDFDFF